MRMRTRRTDEMIYLSLAVGGIAAALWLSKQFHVGIATTAITLTTAVPFLYHAWVKDFRVHRGQDADDLARTPTALLTIAADALADAVWRQWDRALRDRKLHVPAPIPVRWSWSRRPVTGPVAVALEGPQEWARFSALPDVPVAGAAAVSEGGLSDLFPVYGGLGSGRVAVLGSPGSGKSEAAVLTVLDALKHRRSLDDAQRAQVPVPVLLTPAGWDAGRQHIGDWLASRLAAEYRFLRSSDYGRNAAVQLVEDGRVALFLDGFDEVAPELRSVALNDIDQHATFRVVVFTRTKDFADTVRAGHLRGAAALELSPVARADAAEYLRCCQVEPLPASWERLLAHLREQPNSVISCALDSPLTLTLVRDAFPDPTSLEQLLAPNRFAVRDEVVAYLLDRIVDITYQPLSGPSASSYEPTDARRWLGYIAAQMARHSTYDLTWRRLHWWASPLTRLAISGVLGLLTTTLVGAVVFGPVGQYTVTGHTGTLFGIKYGAAMGLTFGLAAGLVSELRDPSPRGLGRLLGRGSTPLRQSFDPAVGLLIGLAVTLAVGNQTFYPYGFAAGLVACTAAGFDATRVHPDLGRTARSRWKTLHSRVALATGSVAGLPIAMAYGLTKNVPYGLAAGIVSTFTVGLMVGAARPLARADTPTDPGTSWSQDRRHSALFGLVSGLCLGLAFGIGNGQAHGFVAGLVATIGFGSVIGLGGIFAVSDAWRTSLLFLQLWHRGLFPARGMRFLKDAYDRRVLRAEGPRYRFRHALLQDKLAETWIELPRRTVVEPASTPVGG